MRKNTRLTLKTAKALIKQELNLSAAQLTTERASNDVYIYAMELGRFKVTVENDWYNNNGLFKINICTHTGANIDIFYNPITLEEDFGAYDKLQEEIQKDRCADCPLNQNNNTY